MSKLTLHNLALGIINSLNNKDTVEERKITAWDILTKFSKAFLQDEEFLHDPEALPLLLEMIQITDQYITET